MPNWCENDLYVQCASKAQADALEMLLRDEDGEPPDEWTGEYHGRRGG